MHFWHAVCSIQIVRKTSEQQTVNLNKGVKNDHRTRIPRLHRHTHRTHQQKLIPLKKGVHHDPSPPHPRRNRRRHHNLQKPQRHLQQLNNPNKGINHEPNRNLRRRNRRTHLPHLQKQITTNKGDYYDTDHRIRYRSIRTLRIPQKITPINKGTPAMTEIENFALAAEKLVEYLIGKRKQTDNATKYNQIVNHSPNPWPLRSGISAF